MKNKPSIVFVHGIWADGSSFSKVIPALQADGHEVIAAQYGLDTLKGVESSHVPMLSKPEFVVDVIRTAAKSVAA
jgi:hypothetical protein